MRMEVSGKTAASHFTIRPASKDDAEKIAALLSPYAKQKLLLPRTAADIAACLGNFKVAEKDGLVVGCCALKNYGDGLFEVRSLAVEKSCNNLGIGSALVQACVKKAARHGKARVFALTYRPELFKRLGFKSVLKTLFPQKIWTDCRVCSKRDNCDEEAVLLEIDVKTPDHEKDEIAKAFKAASGEKIDLFVYGTLMDDQHVRMLLKRKVESVPAKLNNFMKISPPWSFPLIVKHHGATTYGRILKNLTKEDLATIDEFEREGVLYKRQIVIARTKLRRQRCQTYVGNIVALQKYFGKELSFEDKYKTFIQKKIDKVIKEIPPDKPDTTERVMHELSSSAVDGIIQSHFDGNYICDYIMIQAIKEAKPPKLVEVLKNSELIPYAANYMRLACQHMILNQFVEMTSRDFPNDIRLSEQYFRHGLAVLVALSFYNRNAVEINRLIHEKSLDAINDGWSYTDYAKKAIEISDIIYDHAGVRDIIGNIDENWYSTPTPLGAELEFSYLGKRAVEALPGEDSIYDSFNWFWDFDMYHRTWRLGGHVDSHTEITGFRERHRGFFEYALGRYNIVGDLSRPLFDCPWGMSQLINEAVKFLDIPPHSLHISMELPKSPNRLITDKTHKDENLACLVMIGGDVRPDKDGILRAIRIHEGELDTNKMKSLNFLDRKIHFAKQDQEESEGSDVMEYKFMRLFKEWTDYESIIVMLKGYQFGSKCRPIRSSVAKNEPELPEQTFLRKWGEKPYPLDKASISRFLDVVENGIKLENKMNALDRRKKQIMIRIREKLIAKNNFIREYYEKRQSPHRNI